MPVILNLTLSACFGGLKEGDQDPRALRTLSPNFLFDISRVIYRGHVAVSLKYFVRCVLSDPKSSGIQSLHRNYFLRLPPPVCSIDLIVDAAPTGVEDPYWAIDHVFSEGRWPSKNRMHSRGCVSTEYRLYRERGQLWLSEAVLEVLEKGPKLVSTVE